MWARRATQSRLDKYRIWIILPQNAAKNRNPLHRPWTRPRSISNASSSDNVSACRTKPLSKHPQRQTLALPAFPQIVATSCWPLQRYTRKRLAWRLAAWPAKGLWFLARTERETDARALGNPWRWHSTGGKPNGTVSGPVRDSCGRCAPKSPSGRAVPGWYLRRKLILCVLIRHWLI